MIRFGIKPREDRYERINSVILGDVMSGNLFVYVVISLFGLIVAIILAWKGESKDVINRKIGKLEDYLFYILVAALIAITLFFY